MSKLLETSEAELNSSVGAGIGSKPSGTKAAVIFAFGNKFKCWHEEARTLRQPGAPEAFADKEVEAVADLENFGGGGF